ncbi:HAD-IIA family hydrolase [bacterium]|nr:HAD-IIA family hydrolase [bacterium]
MQMYNSILDIYKSFDAFVFDANGVLWGGKDWFDGVLDTLQKLISEGKIVYIFSNSTFRADFTISQYEKYNLKRDIHYTKIITNGEIVHEFLKNKLLKFTSNPTPLKYYNLFYPNKALFENTPYKEVSDMADADFIYIGIPRIHSSQTDIIGKYSSMLNNFGGNTKTFFDKEGDVWYDCLEMTPFNEMLEGVKSLKLPVLNINPDFTAKENGAFVIRQGSIANEFLKSEIEVVQFGKPLKITFENALKDLSSISKDKILMIGDSISNDIVGANNYGIKSALVCHTGLTANEVLNGDEVDTCKLSDLIKQNNATVDFIIKKVAV